MDKNTVKACGMGCATIIVVVMLLTDGATATTAAAAVAAGCAGLTGWAAGTLNRQKEG